MRIDGDVLEVIERSNTVGLHLYLPGQIDRKMYLRVNKALELAGGKWHRGHKAHLFNVSAEDAIEQMVLTGEVVDAKREFDAFYTPPELAQSMCELAALKSGSLVLEPSAGDGAIALEASLRGALVDCIEIRSLEASKLRAAGRYHQVLEGDFLGVPPPPEPAYDTVLMNPPFSKRQDVKHVIHARAFLRPGGRLVAIMSAAITFRQDALTRSLRSEIEATGSIVSLSKGAFKSSGTMVNAAMVSMGAL